MTHDGAAASAAAIDADASVERNGSTAIMAEPKRTCAQAMAEMRSGP
jgi:hypothetical protein